MVLGKDIIGLAQTGSGKTGAFAIPILQALIDAPQAFFACVLSPTRFLISLLFFFLIRYIAFVCVECSGFNLCFCFCSSELAIQISQQFEALGAGIGVKCAAVSFLLN